MRHFIRFEIIFKVAVDGQFDDIPSISLFVCSHSVIHKHDRSQFRLGKLTSKL